MKKAYLLFIIPLLFAACQPKPEAAATTAAPKYPYTIKHPDYWDIDTSHATTMVALGVAKAFETNDTATLKKSFSDSVAFNYDGGVFKGTNAQFIKMLGDMAALSKSIKIDMKDWEAVVSKDKKENWVTIWYTEKTTDLKGKTDSVAYIDDIRFKDGKIAQMDEYARHFKAK